MSPTGGGYRFPPVPIIIEVKAGFVPAASQMSITVAPTDTCRRQVYVEKVGGFVCPVSGVYYIGWHAMLKGPLSNTRTFIDDITISASDNCEAPSITTNSVVGEDSVQLVASIAGGSGGVPRYQWYTGAGVTPANRIAGATTAVYIAHTTGVYSCRVYVVDSLNCMSWDSATATVHDCQPPLATPLLEDL